MTVSSTNNRAAYSGNGVTTGFSFPNYFLADADLVVLLVDDATGAETPQTITTHYTVSGAGNPAGGTVTMLVAPASGTTLVIYRDPPLTQGLDLVENDEMPAESLERALDRLTMQLQRTREIGDRTLRQPEGDTVTIGELPLKASRASKFLAFDSNGDPAASAGTTGTVPVSAFMETVLAAANLAAFMAAVGLDGETQIDFTSTDAGAAEEPIIALYRNSASPANNDLLGGLRFDGKSSTGVRRTVAKILAQIIDTTNASEDAVLLLQSIVAGTLATRATVGQGIQVGAPTGGDKGVGTINATGIYVNDVAVVTSVPDSVPAGTIVAYAGSAAPTGWSLVDGGLLNRTTEAALFAVIGTTYGAGDGSTTFNKPDLRGRVAVGRDNMGGSAANRVTSTTMTADGQTLGATGGTQTHTLVSGEMPAHTHTTPISSSGTGTGPSAVDANKTVTGSLTSSSAGSGGAHLNMQPSIILNYIIKL